MDYKQCSFAQNETEGNILWSGRLENPLKNHRCQIGHGPVEGPELNQDHGVLKHIQDRIGGLLFR